MRPIRRAGWVWASSGAPAAEKMHGRSARAQAWRINLPLSFFVAGFSSFLSPSHSAMRRGAWKCGDQRQAAASAIADKEVIEEGAAVGKKKKSKRENEDGNLATTGHHEMIAQDRRARQAANQLR